MSQHDDRLYLTHMRESAEKAIAFTQSKTRDDYDRDELLQLALLHLLQIIGEAAGSVSASTRAKLTGLPWSAITGIRHRIVHGYAVVDHDVIWNTIVHDLEPLLTSIRAGLDSEEPL
jgi:uncharacterized protein with HEPN domain